MRSRLRTAASAISAERRSPCAPTRSDCACSRSFSAPPRIACRSRCRFSAVCASRSRERAFSTPATAVTRSFWPCTNSLASMANSGAPRSTKSPGRAISWLTRPEIGREDRRRRVLVDRDLAVGRAFVAEGDLAHRREPEARPLRVARPEGAVGLARILLGTRHRVAGRGVEAPEADHRRRHDHGSAGRDPQAISPEARPQRRVGLRGHERGSPVGMFRETAQT